MEKIESRAWERVADNEDLTDEEAIAELIEGIRHNPIPFKNPEWQLCDHDWSGHVCGLCEPGYHLVCSKCEAQLCTGLFDGPEEAGAALEVVTERIAASLDEDPDIDPGMKYHA